MSAAISLSPEAAARAAVNEATPQRRGGYVDTNAVRTMSEFLSDGAAPTPERIGPGGGADRR
jgi:hypothetical protein